MPACRSSRARRGRCARAALNMDVPISLGVVLALAMSVLQTLAARARRLFRQRADAADVPARRTLSRPADAPAHARLRRQSLRDPRRPRRQAHRRRRSARDADRRDRARRSRARARRRAHRRRRHGRGRALGDRPEPGHRRDRAGRGRARRDGLRRHAQPRPARLRVRVSSAGERHASSTRSTGCSSGRSSSARPMCASPTAPRGSMCRSFM